MIQRHQSANGTEYEDESSKCYIGKYRGTVYNNIDPNGEGRVQVVVPDVQPGPLLHWAVLATPIGGFQNGVYAVPPIGSGVWIEFERGDIDYPVCTGGFWASKSEIPRLGTDAQVPVLNSIALQTPTQNGITISDVPAGDNGGVQIKTTFGATISLTATGVTIENGLGASIEMIGPTIKIEAPGGVNINSGALSII